MVVVRVAALVFFFKAVRGVAEKARRDREAAAELDVMDDIVEATEPPRADPPPRAVGT